MQCDASSVALGAVLMQGELIAYASKSLTTAEKKLLPNRKRSIGCCVRVKGFDQLIYGLRVHVELDHQPLEITLKKPIRDAPKRLLRMSYHKGSELYIADTLSRAVAKF